MHWNYTSRTRLPGGVRHPVGLFFFFLVFVKLRGLIMLYFLAFLLSLASDYKFPVFIVYALP